MEIKWFSIMIVGIALAFAIALAGFQFANAPIGVACASAGSEWRAGNCIPKGTEIK